MLLLQPPRCPEGERQETAETWDFQTFSESDAAGEEEERFPAPSQAGINRLESLQCSPWPRAEISPDKHKCPCKPLGTWGSTWLSPPKSITGSTLPGGGITHGLTLAGVSRWGLEVFLLAARDVQTGWLPTACPPAAPSQGTPLVVPSLPQLLPVSGLEQMEMFSGPRVCSEMDPPQ